MKKSIVVGIILLFLLSSLIPIASSYSSYETNKTYTIHIDENGTLSGYVTDPTMNPIEGAKVRVYFHETYEENYTDSSGYYHVTNIPICNCTKNATVSKEGYRSECVLLSIDETTIHNFTLTRLSNTLYVGGSGPGNYSRIQDAVDNASDGDTVFAYSGTYYENVIVDKSINLIGEDKNTTVIDSRQNTGENIRIIVIESNKFNITGFTILDSVIISYSRFIVGISLIESSSVDISDSIIKKCSRGIESIDSSFNVNHCIITKNTNGIALWNSYVSIKNNIITDNSLGINSIDSPVTIENNEINSNKIYGIYISHYFLQPYAKITIDSNNIEGNLYGLFISGVRNYPITVCKNNFIKNTYNSIFVNSLLIKWSYNYWDDWKGFGPKPIMGYLFSYWGVTGYGIRWYNFDWHPAKEPYDISMGV